jgi:hypothetical protein
VRNLFSPTLLKAHGRKVAYVSVGRPEAQYAYELYRCLHIVTGEKCSIQCEYSLTEDGKIDFFLKGKNWGLEVLREGDRMQNHLDRFGTGGAYGKWGIMEDHILLDFRSRRPRFKRGRMSPINLLVFNICFLTIF